MAEGALNWDFDCPQFFDFCNGVEESTINFQNLGGNSPALENKFSLKSKNFMKHKLGTWNKYSTISTPANKSPFVNINRPTNATDTEKLNAEKKRLSKSEGCLDSVVTLAKVLKKNCPTFTRKRSLSESDARPKRKFHATPKKFPATPMCLKRTQRKDKTKKLKTTEELELEKIAELQSLTRKHLRLNEKNMKKLKLKPKSRTIPKPAPSKDEKKEKSAPVKQFQKDLDDVVKRLNSDKNMRRFAALNQAKHSERLDAISSVSDVELPSSSYTSQLPGTDVVNEAQMAVDEKNILNELSFKKSPGHSGVFFHMNTSKSAALKPFNFNDRIKDSAKGLLSKSSIKTNKENLPGSKVQFSHSFHSSHLRNRNNNKENNFGLKMAPKTDAGIIKKSFKY